MIRNLFFLFMFLLAASSVKADVNVAASSQISGTTSFAKGIPAEISTLSPESMLTMTPAKFKEMTGRKMKWKEVIALKSAQKMVKKSMPAEGEGGNSRSQLVALLLAIFLGVFGIHRFYLGYIGIGIIQLLTAGGCGIWYIIDIIMIITGDLGPKDGSNYDPEL